MNAFRKLPIDQVRRLIERLALAFHQCPIMQGIVDKIGFVVAARMHGDRFAPSVSVRRSALTRSSLSRHSSPAASPPATKWREILLVLGKSDLTIQRAILNSSDTKIVAASIGKSD
jgi:hypothetical protein